MKILQVNKFNYVRGGAEKYFIDISKKLTEMGHDVAIFSMHHPKNMESKYDKYFVSRISFNEAKWKDKLLAPFRILYSFEARRKFAKLLDDFKPDIIHIHNIYHQISPSILHAAKKRKIKVVMHLHDYKLVCPNYQMFVNGEVCSKCCRHKYYNCVKYKCFKSSFWQSLLAAIEMYFHHNILGVYRKNIDLYIAPSAYMKNVLLKFGFQEDKIKLLYNFSDKNVTNNFKEEDYLLYFGRISPEKGIDVLIRSMTLNKNKFKLKIVGSGPMQSELENVIKELSLEDRVSFLGYRSGSALDELILKARAVVMPSVWAENMPLSLIEAMQMSKLLIVSNTGGMPELIKHKETGFLFEKANAQDLADTIDVVLQSDQEYLNTIKSRARDKALGLNSDNNVQSLLNFYKELL